MLLLPSWRKYYLLKVFLNIDTQVKNVVFSGHKHAAVTQLVLPHLSPYHQACTEVC